MYKLQKFLNPNLLFKKYLWETGVSISNINLIKNLLKRLKVWNIKKIKSF